MKEEEIDKLLHQYETKKKYETLQQIDSDAAFQRFCKRIGSNAQEHKVVSLKKVWLSMAATAVVAITIGAYMFIGKEEPASMIADIQPGTDCAYLTTAGGKSVALNNESQTINEDGFTASVTDGELSIGDGNSEALNTITVPRGGEFRITLSDGTRIHLNSESTLEFPNHFTGTTREVTLTGEAYLEVAHQAEAPFIVHVAGADVKQYGTHYNINAYETNNLQVTLVEGSISIAANGSQEKMLRQGEQAVVSNGMINIHKTDVSRITAWEKGEFVFDEEPLQDIAQTLSRWYNKNIEVDPSLASRRFTGVLMRDDNLADILDAIGEITETTYEYNSNTIKLHKR